MRGVPETSRVAAVGVESGGGHARAPSVRWCRAWLVTLGVGGELEEQVLEAGAVGGPQLDEGDALGGRDLADLHGLGVAAQPVAGRHGGDALRASASQQRLVLDGLHVGAAGLQQLLPWCPGRRSGRRPIRISSSAIRSTSCSRCEESSTVPPRVGVLLAAARASSGCPPGPGRWPARRGSGSAGRRAARARCRAAAACPASSCGPGASPRPASSETSSSISSTRVRGSAHGLRTDREDLAAGAAGVLGGRVEQHARRAGPGSGGRRSGAHRW